MPRVALALLLALLTSPAHADAPAQTLSKADRLAIQKAITTHQDKQALARLKTALPAGNWCDATLADPPDEAAAAQLRADLGVLARRARRLDDFALCLLHTLRGPTARGLAAALYELATLLPTLDDDGRRAIAQVIRARFPDTDRCLHDGYGPLSWADCTLTGRTPDGEPLDHAGMARALLTHAAWLAPRPAYVRRLDAAGVGQSRALAPPLHEIPGVKAADAQAAVWAMARGKVDDGPRTVTGTRVVATRGPWRLLDIELFASDDPERTRPEARRAMLIYGPEGTDGVLAFDLGYLDHYRQPEELTIGPWEPRFGTITARAEKDGDDFSGAITSSRTAWLCQVPEAGPPRCAASFRLSRKYDEISAPVVPGGTPRYAFVGRRLKASADPGQYIHPQFAALEDKSLAEALDMLPAIDRALRAALGHPLPEAPAPTK